MRLDRAVMILWLGACDPELVPDAGDAIEPGSAATDGSAAEAPDEAADPTLVLVTPARPRSTSPPADAPTSGDPADTASAEADPEGVPPRCDLLVPADGAVLPVGEPTWFRGEASDPDGDLAYVLWSSDSWGAMVIGLEFSFILPPGAHRVRMTAYDDVGHACSEEIEVTVASG